ADRIAVPGWRHARGVLRIHANVPDLMIVLIDDDDLVGLLEHLHAEREHEWYAVRPTLVARIVKAVKGDRLFAELLDPRRSLRLQNRIGVIADQLLDIVHPVAPRSVRERRGSGCQRFEAGDGGMDPPTG